jgi:hypothetical protein
MVMRRRLGFVLAAEKSGAARMTRSRKGMAEDCLLARMAIPTLVAILGSVKVDPLNRRAIQNNGFHSKFCMILAFLWVSEHS